MHLRREGLSLDALLDVVEEVFPKVSRASLHRLLVRHGESKKARPKKEAGTFPECLPGFVHIDFFYLPELEGVRHYCYVAVDRATRLVFLHVYDRTSREVAKDFLCRCIAFYPFRLYTALTDNGTEFTFHANKQKKGASRNEHLFEAALDEAGIGHRNTKPYTPKTNGMVERVNGMAKTATVRTHRYDSNHQMISALHLWLMRYNAYKKHSRIGRITPIQKTQQWFQLKPEIFTRDPHDLFHLCSQPGET